MNNTLSLGKTIKAFRVRENISQFNLELMIDASPGSISRIENNKVNPLKETIYKLRKALNISPLESTLLYNQSLNANKDDFIATLTERNKIQIDIKKFHEKMFSDLLSQIDKRNDYLSSFYFKLNTNEQSLDLISLSNSPIQRILKDRLRSKNVYRQINIIDLNGSLTLKAIKSKEIMYGSDLSKFLSPAFENQLTLFIQKIFRVKSMASIPLLDKSNHCFGAVNIALNKRVNELSVSDKHNIKLSGELLSKEIQKLSLLKLQKSYGM